MMSQCRHDVINIRRLSDLDGLKTRNAVGQTGPNIFVKEQVVHVQVRNIRFVCVLHNYHVYT